MLKSTSVQYLPSNPNGNFSLCVEISVSNGYVCVPIEVFALAYGVIDVQARKESRKKSVSRWNVVCQRFSNTFREEEKNIFSLKWRKKLSPDHSRIPIVMKSRRTLDFGHDLTFVGSSISSVNWAKNLVPKNVMQNKNKMAKVKQNGPLKICYLFAHVCAHNDQIDRQMTFLVYVRTLWMKVH